MWNPEGPNEGPMLGTLDSPEAGKESHDELLVQQLSDRQTGQMYT